MWKAGIAPLVVVVGFASGSPAQVADRPRLVFDTAACTSQVNDLAFSPDGRVLAVAGNDKLVRIWDVATGRKLHTLRGYTGKKGVSDGTPDVVAFSPDGAWLVVGIEDQSDEGTIRVYRASDPSEIAALLPGAHAQGGVNKLAFSGDGRFLASAGYDATIVLWDWPARRRLGTIPVAGRLTYLGFPTGTAELFAVDDDGVAVWSAPHVRRVSELDARALEELFPGPGGFDRARARGGEIVARLGAVADLPALHGGRFTIRCFDLANGRAFLGGQGDRAGNSVFWAGLWRLPEARSPSPLFEDLHYRPTALAIGPGGKTLAVGDFFGEVSIRDAATAATTRVLGELTVRDPATGKVKERFRSDGYQFYRAGFDAEGRRLGFGTTPFLVPGEGPTGWRYNNYAKADRTFDIGAREVRPGAPGPITRERADLGDRALSPEKAPGGPFALVSRRGGRVESRYTLPPLAAPWCYSYLTSRAPGFDAPVVLGQQNGQLSLFDPRTMLRRRDFLGHDQAVASVAESPDGRYLVSASLDRTVRVYSLENLKEDAWPDFDIYGDWVVNYVVPGGEAERAGVRVGDRWLKMDGIDVTTLWQRYLDGPLPYKLGQHVAIDLERKGRPYRVEVALADPCDLAEPLLSFFETRDGEWVAWTPQGYYDASLNGDRLIGWQVNQGRAKAAKYYSAQQFRKELHRPDIIRRLLEAGSVPGAIALADRDDPNRRPTGVIDVDHDLPSLEPPKVRFLAPTAGLRTREARVTVHVEAVSQNDLPVREITLLVNGIPLARGKDVSREKDRAGMRPTPAGPRHYLELRREVDLEPGRTNLIEALARNEKSQSGPMSVAVTNEAAGPLDDRCSLYVLSIGVSRYQQPNIPTLQYAHRDAIEFAEAWKRQEGPVYKAVEARVLTDERATQKEIHDGLDWLAHAATHRDVAILFVSGHGTRDDRGVFYLPTHELDVARLRATGVQYKEITDFIRDMNCKFHLYVDTCHSGAVTGAKAADFDDPLRDLVTADRGTVVFASCTAREVSYEHKDWEHGAFTKAFLDTVRDPRGDLNRPPDDFLSVKEIDFQLTQAVKKLTGGRQHMSIHIPEIFTDYNVARYVLKAE